MGRKTSARRLGGWRTDGFWDALAAFVVMALCVAAGVPHRLELQLYDAAVSTSPPAPLSEIVLVGMDDASVASLGPGPWSRDLHARLIDQLSTAGAKTIVYTPLLPDTLSTPALSSVRKIRETLARASDEPSIAELARSAAEAEAALDADTRLASSMQRAGNVLLASQYTPTGPSSSLPGYVRRSALPDTGAQTPIATSARHPASILGEAAVGIGHTYAPADEDGTLRQLPLLLRYDSAAIPSLALLAARHSLHLGSGEVRFQESPPLLRLGGAEFPTTPAGTLRLRGLAPAEGAGAFPTVSFVEAVDGKVPASAFKDKVVLVGETSGALSLSSTLPGGQVAYPVEWLAQSISAIRQNLLVTVPTWSAAVSWIAVALGLLFVAGGLPRMSAPVGMAASVVLGVALAAVEWSLLRQAGLWVPLVLAALGILAGALLRSWRLAWPGSGASAPSSEAAEADRMMGLALHGQGQLDQAFERLRKVPATDAVMDNLYHLAHDFERKRNFAQAKAVYEHILRHNRAYKDARSRYKRARAHISPHGSHDAPASQPPAPAPAPHHIPRLPGDVGAGVPMLGRYQIDRELGKGAMGVVYQGRDPKIGRVVAIKTLALGQEFEGDALIDARARFFREAETAGRLQHPHIVTIFDAGEEHDLAYIAMEFLKGTDLAPICSKDRLLDVSTVLSIAARVADALDYAHAHNVVHRDIKPANIMFDRASDTVKVTDFGIARITDSSKTRTGLVLGTPSFMSPEQLAGKKVDGRSDLYSLGVTLFQLLTGSLPLRGESMTELMHKIASVQPPDVRELRPDLSPAVAQVVALAIQKRPEARYQTGRQMAADLRSAASGSAGKLAVPAPGAVVYDADRDATGHGMADFQETVMEPPAMRDAASPPISGAR